MLIKIAKVDGTNVKLPTRAHATDAGLDFYVPDSFKQVTLHSNESVLIPSGIKIEIPYSYMGLFLNKSSLGSKGLLIGAQVIDTFYSNEVYIDVHNVSPNNIDIIPGMKIAQLVLVPIAYATPVLVDDSELYQDMKIENVRGLNGFGSSGSKWLSLLMVQTKQVKTIF